MQTMFGVFCTLIVCPHEIEFCKSLLVDNTLFLGSQVTLFLSHQSFNVLRPLWWDHHTMQSEKKH